MLLPFLVSPSSASLYEREFTDFDLDFARQAGDLKLSSPAASSGSSLLKGILLNAGKAGAGEVASIAEVDLKSTFFAPTSATIPAAAPATTSASAAGCKFLFLALIVREGLSQLPI